MREQHDYNNQTDDPIEIQFEENVDIGVDNFEEDYEEDFDGEEEKLPPLVLAGVFLGLVVLAAIICAVLWSFTHKNKENDQHVKATETIQDISAADEDQENQALEASAAENESSENETAENEIKSSESADDEKSMTAEELEDGVNAPVGENQENTANDGQADDTAEANTGQEETGQEPISGNESMEFAEVSDMVTAKDVTNLRSVPSTLDAENVVSQLLNGETLSRTGVNDATGWSRLDYDGQTVYAVTGYLTTDLTYKPPVAAADPNRITTQDGRVIIFTNCDDYITPKEYVNLRVEPSTSQGDATAKCQISNGTVVHRTGYSPDSGWSRVEYNGEILYVVSSMVYNTDAVTE